MLTATNMLVNRYKLLEFEYALIINLQLEVLWTTPNLKQLQFLDNSDNFKLPFEYPNMWHYFLQQLQQQSTSNLLLPVTDQDKQTVYHVKGIYDSVQQLVVLILHKIEETNTPIATDNSPQLLNYFQQGILLTTINHSIVHFNQYIEKMIPKQFLQQGNDVRELFSEGIIKFEQQENITDVLQRHKSYIGNCTIAGKHMRIIIFFDEKLYRYIYMFEDISELIQLKKQLTNQEYLSEIGKMASTLVHEMRNPMTSIKGYVDLMLMDQRPEMDYMKIIERELTHLTQLCSDILFLSKPIQKIGKGVDLLKIVQEVKQLMEIEVQGTKIDIHLTYDEGAKYIVAGNEMYFKQVVLNMVKNAVQAIDDVGLVEIVLRENIHSVQLSVKDNGCGIDQEILNNVFEMFYTTKEYGTGLGLPVVKKIVEQLNGKIDVKSTVGIGTNFTITIPTFH